MQLEREKRRDGRVEIARDPQQDSGYVRDYEWGRGRVANAPEIHITTKGIRVVNKE